MSFSLNGMSFSYDYSELLEDIRADLEDDIVKTNTILHVVRGPSKQLTTTDFYKPIIDYYLPTDLQDLQQPLEYWYNREDYTDKEWQQLLNENKQQIEQYKKDASKFEPMSVLAMITEMEQWNSII